MLTVNLVIGQGTKGAHHSNCFDNTISFAGDIHDNVTYILMCEKAANVTVQYCVSTTL